MSDKLETRDEPQAPMSTAINNPSHLMNKAALPAVVRFGIPIFLIGVLSLLLPSDFGSGVSLDARIDGLKLDIKLREVSVISSVKELWNADSMFLAILIVILSISWPYLNLLLTFLCWVIPWKTANAHRRETFIAVLDALGKWGLFDTFVLIMMMSTLRIVTDPAALGFGALVSSDSDSGTEQQQKLRTFLTPLWGFYGFLIAALLSLVGSHLVLYYQRKVIYFKANDRDKDGKVEEDGDAEGQYTDDDIKCLTAVKLTSLGGISLCHPMFYIIPSMVLIATLSVGFSITVITFTYITNEGAEEIDFSLVSLGLKITDSPLPGTNKNGPRFMVVIYFLMSLVIPLINIVVFVVLYLYPMKKDAQKIALYLAEVTFAWGTCGPLIFALFTSAAQIPRFANSLIGENCNGCFRVESELKWTVVVFLWGAVGHGIAAYYLLHKAHGALYLPSSKK